MYKIRVILDTEKDVIRTFLVDHSINLESLHSIIANSFDFNGSEMASFYTTDDQWNQGEEIPLFNMSESGEGISMQQCLIKNTLPKVGDKLIYVYDYLNMWTFYVETIKISENSSENSLPKTILSVGEIPDEVPEKKFKAALLESDLDDEFEDDFRDDFESLDSIDFDQY